MAQKIRRKKIAPFNAPGALNGTHVFVAARTDSLNIYFPAVGWGYLERAAQCLQVRYPQQARLQIYCLVPIRNQKNGEKSDFFAKN